jgi:hypothetical protein
MLTAPTVRQGHRHRLSEPRPRIRSSHQILASWRHWGFIPIAWSRPARPDCTALPPGCPHARRAVVGGVDLMQGEGGWATKNLQATFNLLASRMPVQTVPAGSGARAHGLRAKAGAPFLSNTSEKLLPTPQAPRHQHPLHSTASNPQQYTAAIKAAGAAPQARKFHMHANSEVLPAQPNYPNPEVTNPAANNG